MNENMSLLQNRAAEITSEKVGVHHIRITHPGMHSSAVIGSFSSADKIMSSWALLSGKHFQCNFEIIYVDGRILTGLYYRWKKRGVAIRLSDFVRQQIQRLTISMNYDAVKNGLKPLPVAISNLTFLNSYETKDFSDPDSRNDQHTS